jgi:hypothetical protein
MARRETRFYLRITLIVVAFVLIVGYSYFRAENLLTGPRLEILEPKNGTTLKTPEIVLKGEAKNISFLTLNGRQIYTDSAGNFSRELLLSGGYNIITVVAKDKFNRVVQKSIQLTYEQTSAVETDNANSTTTQINISN